MATDVSMVTLVRSHRQLHAAPSPIADKMPGVPREHAGELSPRNLRGCIGSVQAQGQMARLPAEAGLDTLPTWKTQLFPPRSWRENV